MSYSSSLWLVCLYPTSKPSISEIRNGPQCRSPGTPRQANPDPCREPARSMAIPGSDWLEVPIPYIRPIYVRPKFQGISPENFQDPGIPIDNIMVSDCWPKKKRIIFNVLFDYQDSPLGCLQGKTLNSQAAEHSNGCTLRKPFRDCVPGWTVFLVPGTLSQPPRGNG